MANLENQTNEEIENIENQTKQQTEIVELWSENEVEAKPKRMPRKPKSIIVERNQTNEAIAQQTIGSDMLGIIL